MFFFNDLNNTTRRCPWRLST